MFRFRLQKVLELREQREQEQAAVLFEAEQLAQTARDEEAQLRVLHSENSAKLLSARSLGGAVGHLHQLNFVLGELELRLAKAAEKVSHADGTVVLARTELELRARDRRVLDRLKEKHGDVHRAEEVQRDRVMMDEVALARYTRRGTITTDGAAEG